MVIIASNLWLVMGISIAALPVASAASMRKANAPAANVANAIGARSLKDQCAIIAGEDEITKILKKAECTTAKGDEKIADNLSKALASSLSKFFPDDKKIEDLIKSLFCALTTT